MLLVATGDWQASVHNLERLQIITKHIIRILDASKHTHKYLLHLGDSKDAFNPVDVRVTNFLIQSFIQLRKHCLGILYVRGNHDNITTQDNVPSCLPWLQAAGAETADTSWSRQLLANKVWLTSVPYFRDADLQKQMFQDALTGRIENGFPHVLAFHNEITGCKRNAYSKGVGLTTDDIGADRYTICLGGHIHTPQFLSPNVHFVGSPAAWDWNDVNLQHRIMAIEV